MKSALPKVLHPLLGRTLLGHVLAAAAPLRRGPHRGRGRARRRAGRAPTWPRSPRTPHRCCRPSSAAPGTPCGSRWTRVPEATGTVVVLNGDVPLLRAETVQRAGRGARGEAGAAATVLAAEVPDPTGLGRIVRDARRPAGADRRGARRDPGPAGASGRSTPASTPSTRPGCATRWASCPPTTTRARSTSPTSSGCSSRPASRSACTWPPTHVETLGCNDRVELAGAAPAAARPGQRGVDARPGVTILDPATTWIDVTVTARAGTR